MATMASEVRILFNAIFRDITKKKEIIEKIDEDCDIAFILAKLAKKYGRDFNSIIDPETGKVASDILVLLNGRAVRDTDLKLKDTDVLIITVAVGGG